MIFLATIALPCFGQQSGNAVVAKLDRRETAKAPSQREFNIGLEIFQKLDITAKREGCLLYTSPSPRDATLSRMPSSA